MVQRIDGQLSDDLLDFKTILAFVPKGTNQKNLNFGAFIDSISIMSSEGEFRFFFAKQRKCYSNLPQGFLSKKFQQNLKVR